MADLPVPKHYEVKPNVEVRKLWVDQQIAEKETRVKRLEADAEEIMRAQIARIKADIIMLKREVANLYSLKDQLEQYNNNDVIDVKQLENKGG
jgi:hypothetical protein